LTRVVAEAVRSRILPLRGAMARLSTSAGAPAPDKPVEDELLAIERTPCIQEARAVVPRAQGFVDLFSGAGGFKLGFARAGLAPLVCADNSGVVQATHLANYPDIPFVLGDLGLPDVQKQVASITGPEPFAVVGGPPCQGFSVFGKRRMSVRTGLDARDDPRNRLVFSFVDTIARLNPRWVVMENVAGFASLDEGSFVKRVRAEFIRIGYSTIEYRILDAADYGVPQRRKRFVLIANRTGHVIPWPKRKFFEKPMDWQKPFRTVGEAIGDLAEPGSHAIHTCHVPMNHKPLQVERYRRIPEGGRLDVDALPAELRKAYRSDEVKNFSHVFKRLHRKRPSGTLVPGHNAFPIHPWLDRALTVREAARLQTFPDEIEFKGAREDQGIQVGNAFPPLLAELIANNLLKAEANDWYPGAVPKLARYTLLELDDAQPELPLAPDQPVTLPSTLRSKQQELVPT